MGREKPPKLTALMARVPLGNRSCGVHMSVGSVECEVSSGNRGGVVPSCPAFG